MSILRAGAIVRSTCSNFSWKECIKGEREMNRFRPVAFTAARLVFLMTPQRFTTRSRPPDSTDVTARVVNVLLVGHDLSHADSIGRPSLCRFVAAFIPIER